MRELFVAGGCLAVLFAYLAVEVILLRRRRRRIPMRIAVTGTRGKSSVVRLIAAAMREDGRPVLAKTTGSQPVLIYPESKEEVIHRRGTPNIREGTRLIRTAADLGVRALVAEMMSIQPESIKTESLRILAPHLLVLTNARVDHVAQMGTTRDSVARCLATAISENTTVFVPEEECLPVLEQWASRVGATLVRVPPGAPLPRRFEEWVGPVPTSVPSKYGRLTSARHLIDGNSSASLPPTIRTLAGR
jgi:poly-gamma-glutamate synthase PgsB/CapB